MPGARFITAAFWKLCNAPDEQTYDKRKQPGLPVWASVLILSVSFAFIVWYFIILPIRLHKKDTIYSLTVSSTGWKENNA